MNVFDVHHQTNGLKCALAPNRPFGSDPDRRVWVRPRLARLGQTQIGAQVRAAIWSVLAEEFGVGRSEDHGRVVDEVGKRRIVGIEKVDRDLARQRNGLLVAAQ